MDLLESDELEDIEESKNSYEDEMLNDMMAM